MADKVEKQVDRAEEETGLALRDSAVPMEAVHTD